MGNPLNDWFLFSLSLILGMTMLIEGFSIVKLHKQIIPLPSRLLYWIGVGLLVKEKSTQKFSGKNTPENLRTYAFFTLFFGSAMVISSFIYLNWILTQS